MPIQQLRLLDQLSSKRLPDREPSMTRTRLSTRIIVGALLSLSFSLFTGSHIYAQTSIGPYKAQGPDSLAPPAAIVVPDGSGKLVPPSSAYPLPTIISPSSEARADQGTPADPSAPWPVSLSTGNSPNADNNPIYVAPGGASIFSIQPATQNTVSGTASQTTGGVSTLLIPSIVGSKIYVLAYTCSNTGGSTSLISFQDGNGGTTLWTQSVLAGGNISIGINMPLFSTGSGNDLYFSPDTSSTTLYCSASGLAGP